MYQLGEGNTVSCGEMVTRDSHILKKRCPKGSVGLNLQVALSNLHCHCTLCRMKGIGEIDKYAENDEDDGLFELAHQVRRVCHHQIMKNNFNGLFQEEEEFLERQCWLGTVTCSFKPTEQAMF